MVQRKTFVKSDTATVAKYIAYLPGILDAFAGPATAIGNSAAVKRDHIATCTSKSAALELDLRSHKSMRGLSGSWKCILDSLAPLQLHGADFGFVEDRGSRQVGDFFMTRQPGPYTVTVTRHSDRICANGAGAPTI